MSFYQKAQSTYERNKKKLEKKWDAPQEVRENGVTKVVSYFFISLLFFVVIDLFTLHFQRAQCNRGCGEWFDATGNNLLNNHKSCNGSKFVFFLFFLLRN